MGDGTIADLPLVGSNARAILAVGTVVAALESFIRSCAGGYIHGSVVHDLNPHSDRFVADGPYRPVRNPLYLGTILLAIGIGAIASRIVFSSS